MNLERVAHGLKQVAGKKCDLAFVVIFVIEESITAQTTSRNAFDFGDFNARMIARRLAVMSKEIVAAGNIEMPNRHALTISIAFTARKAGNPKMQFSTTGHIDRTNGGTVIHCVLSISRLEKNRFTG